MQEQAGHRRAVVTGLGCATPLGVGVAATWDAALAGTSGVGPLSRFDPAGLPVRIAAECAADAGPHTFQAKEARRLDRVSRLALAAAEEAIADAGLAGGALD